MGTFASPFPAPSKLFGPVNGATGWLSFVPFVATATSTIANSVAETTLLSTSGAFGSKTIPANYLSAGSMIKVYITGSISTDAVAPTITMQLKYGATVLSTTGAFTPAAQLTTAFFEYTATVNVATIGAGANVISGQAMWVNSLTTNGPSAVPALVSANTTIAGAIDVTLTWGTAAATNTVSALTGYIEVIG